MHDAKADQDVGHRPEDDAHANAYAAGRAAALAGDEAAPGCTTTEAGRAWLRGYVAGAAERSA